MTSFARQELLEKAAQAAKNGYAPYSGRPQGAALLALDGSTYVACAVENAAWGPAICAEAAAVAAAVTQGRTEFVALAVSPERLPCGTCLQVLREFSLDLEILSGDGARVSSYSLGELLPHSFGPEHLKRG